MRHLGQMKLPRLTRRFAAVALATGFVLGAGGIAAAFLGSSGSGTGSGTVITPGGLTVAVHTYTPPTGKTLGPTGPGEHITFAVSNTSTKAKLRASTVKAFVVALRTATYTGDITTHGAGVTTCLASWFTAKVVKWQVDSTGPSHTPPVTYTISYHTDIHVTVLLTMKTEPVNQAACEGKHPAVTLTVAK